MLTQFTKQLNNNLVKEVTSADELGRSVKTTYKCYDLRVVVETSFDDDFKWRKFYRTTITTYQLDLLLTHHSVGRQVAHNQRKNNRVFLTASDDVARFNWNAMEQHHETSLLVAQQQIASVTNDYVEQLFTDVKNDLLIRSFNQNASVNTFPIYQVAI